MASETVPNGLDGVEVVHALPVDDAVAGVDERRRGREPVRVERRRGGHDLERRSRRVEPLAGAVDERRRRGAVGADPLDAAVALLDVVRVEARRRDHHAEAARSWIERDDRAAVAAECVEGGALAVHVQRRDHGVADDRLAVQLVQGLVDERGEAPHRAGQERVERPLEAGAGAACGRVPDDVRSEPSLRVATEVEGAAAHAPLLVAREDARRRQDQPPLDLELGHPLDRVVLALGEGRPRPRLPVRRRHDQHDEKPEREARDAGDLPVHRSTAVAVALLETSRRRPSMRKLETMEEPP